MGKDRTRTGPKPKPEKKTFKVDLLPKQDLVASAVAGMIANQPEPIAVDEASLHGLSNHLAARCKELLTVKGDLSDNEKAYLLEKLEYMKDEKLKGIIIDLIGWGDDERAELETMFSVLLEVMRRATPEMIRSAAKTVEFRTLLNQVG